VEQVLDVLRKELEDLTIGNDDETTTQTQNVDSAPTAATDDQPQCLTRWRRKVWDLTEKPQSSLPARVSADVIELKIIIVIIGPIPWGHSGPLCHALSLLSWTSMRMRRATVAACDSSDTW